MVGLLVTNPRAYRRRMRFVALGNSINIAVSGLLPISRAAKDTGKAMQINCLGVN